MIRLDEAYDTQSIDSIDEVIQQRFRSLRVFTLVFCCFG